MTATRPVRVMLVDDHQTVREGLRALFASVPNIAVVCEATDGEAAIAAATRIAPDILIVDLSMPGTDGLTVIRKLRHMRRQTKIIVWSRFKDSEYVREAFAAGAVAYVLKQSSFAELRRAIDAAVSGQRHVDAALAQESERQAAATDGELTVSHREGDVLRRSALGHGNREIAESLEIAVKTVEAHKTNAMRKLGFTGRRHLIRYAALKGWFDDV